MHAITREPSPIHNFKRVQLGDVGFIRRGCFHLLFSAGSPLGERQLGIDVPLTFNLLNVGPIVHSQPRLPGYLSTVTVKSTGADLGGSINPVPCVPSVGSVPFPSVPQKMCSRMLEPGSRISFELKGEQGAALITRYRTYREDTALDSAFQSYTKRHYDSWVSFARETGYGDDVRPVLVSGVDMTGDFAMMAYSKNDVDVTSEFLVLDPRVASIWGTWHINGLVHTNCGPPIIPSSSSVISRTKNPITPSSAVGDTEKPIPPSAVGDTENPILPSVVGDTEDAIPPSSVDGHTETAITLPSVVDHVETPSNGFNQCVFVRFYTVRKRLRIPRVIKAAAAPHDLGPAGREDEEPPKVEAQYASDSGSDFMPSLCGDDGDHYGSSTSSINSGSAIATHGTTSVCPLPHLSAYPCTI